MNHAYLGVRPSEGLLAVDSPISHWTVSATQKVSYEVSLCQDVLHPDNPTLLEGNENRGALRRFVVTDSEVDSLYGDRIREYFKRNDVNHHVCVLPAGEQHKTLETAQLLAAELDGFGIDRRRDPLIAIGGGVLLDIAGFVSSTYRRATPFVRVPTTLIGLVDAGVGVKTGVNFNGHKNRIGTYFAASRTLLDRSFLRTLDTRHIANGLAEILKIALIKDAQLFDLLEEHGANLLATRFQGGAEVDPLEGVAPQARLSTTMPAHDPAVEVIERAVHGMLVELQPNLWEQVLERVVDYGHAFSPSIEMLALPELLHGEAVAIDMALTTVLAERRGLVSARQRQRVLALMRTLGLPTWHELCTDDVLLPALHGTIAHRDGLQRMPLPAGIGAALFVNDITEAELTGAAKALHDLESGR